MHEDLKKFQYMPAGLPVSVPALILVWGFEKVAPIGA
jgi:hypothetical protein